MPESRNFFDFSGYCAHSGGSGQKNLGGPWPVGERGERGLGANPWKTFLITFFLP